MEIKKQYKKGHFIGMSLAMGIPLGVPIGLILENIALGPVISLPLALVIGYFLEKKYNINPKELSEAEKSKKHKNLWIVLVTGTIIFFGITLSYFL
jgi:uncharacterized protein YneF (UPF0154 family)